MGTLILTISDRTFSFKNKGNKTVVIQGTFLFDKFTRTLTLFKPDKSVIKLSINQDGNLVLPNGMIYKNYNQSFTSVFQKVAEWRLLFYFGKLCAIMFSSNFCR